MHDAILKFGSVLKDSVMQLFYKIASNFGKVK